MVRPDFEPPAGSFTPDMPGPEYKSQKLARIGEQQMRFAKDNSQMILDGSSGVVFQRSIIEAQQERHAQIRKLQIEIHDLSRPDSPIDVVAQMGRHHAVHQQMYGGGRYSEKSK